MNKFIKFFLVSTLGIIFYTNMSFAQNVEDVFFDIEKDYKYYDEVQTLYDKGMISPDEVGNLNPYKLLNRDEFVGITMEVTCKKCISPGTDIDFINAYAGKKPFFDVGLSNKYFYCIADADKNNYVVGYDKSHVCEDSTTKQGERPFCVNNKISLEEAVAVILRNSGIFTIEDNKKVIDKISSGENLEDLSDDVKALNPDGSINTFYGYIKKALEYELVEYTNNGEKRVYNMIEVINGKIRPKGSVRKEDFLKIAYIALKANSCKQKENNYSIGLEINILDKNCDQNKTNCKLSNLNDKGNTYDFDAQVNGKCEKGINQSKYIWRFYNLDNNNEIIKNGKYIDNFSFLDDGKWRIYLNVVDNCGNYGEVYSEVSVNNSINTDINKEYLEYNLVEFEGILNDNNLNTNDFKFIWDFGDSSSSEGKIVKHNYKENGTYEVTLKVVDKSGNEFFKNTTVKIGNFDANINKDYINLNTVNFDGILSDPNLNTNDFTFSRDFGDGSSALGKNINHTFPNNGVYDVVLKVTDNNGNSSSTSTKVTIGNFDVDINKDYINLNTVNFDSILNDPNLNPNDFTFSRDFGDGSSAVGKNINHTFPDNGVYDVVLKVTDNNGNSSSTSTKVTIGNFDVDINKDYINLNTVNFDSVLNDPNLNPNDFTFSRDFGDGSSAVGKNIDHVYEDAGTYYVTLKTKDKFGNEVSKNTTIVIGDLNNDNNISIYIDADPIGGYSPLFVNFKGVLEYLNNNQNNNNLNENNITYKWTFSDGNVSYGKDVSNLFKEEGVYEVKLDIISDSGYNIGQASVLINVGVKRKDCNLDSDGDSINDCDDKCPIIKGETINFGCPIIDDFCKQGCSCKNGYVCSSQDENSCTTEAICVPKGTIPGISPGSSSSGNPGSSSGVPGSSSGNGGSSSGSSGSSSGGTNSSSGGDGLIYRKDIDVDSCYTEGKNAIIFGNVICNSCPCTYFVDFFAQIRKCDYLIPAITSPQADEIFSKGNSYRIK